VQHLEIIIKFIYMTSQLHYRLKRVMVCTYRTYATSTLI